MRQKAHMVIGLAFWALFATLWAKLFADHKAGLAAFRDTGIQLAAVVGVVVAVTTWWIRHNVGIYRRKGPRRGRPSQPPRTDEDRLGRAVRWDLPGGAIAARAHDHLIVELDGDVKTYRRAG
jgi:hypothetical protein